MATSLLHNHALHITQVLQDALPTEDCRTCQRFQALIKHLEAHALTIGLTPLNVLCCPVYPRRSCRNCMPAEVFTTYLREEGCFEASYMHSVAN